MRPIFRFALTLLLAAPLSVPAVAAEPSAPEALITKAEAIRPKQIKVGTGPSVVEGQTN